jgi:hypothetical protein
MEAKPPAASALVPAWAWRSPQKTVATEKRKGVHIVSQGMSGQSSTNVEKYLKGVDFPAKKQDLVEQAKKNGAPQEVQQEIQRLPNQEFQGPQEVVKAYGNLR